MRPGNRDNLNLAMLAHFLGMLCLLAPPFNIICPLVIWLFKRNDDPYIEFHAREALNFQITLAIAGFVFSILAFLFIGFILMGFLALFALIFGIRASLKASRNEFYQYPFTLRFVK
ncbi:DUF4870 domain-containing protein [Endozoicomonadaceae bacterium StTr2]